jgi:cytochrome c oxidase assembly protein Cox11
MKRLLILIIAMSLLTTFAFAAVKTYQVTGPVLEVTDSMIAVKKGADRWEIARDTDTKITGDLKVGQKVTIEYKMTATKVEVKEGKKAETMKKK